MARAGALSALDQEYFDAYEDMAIHALMLRDKPRCAAYAAALRGADLEGKAVLDVGAGTGLLSVLAAKAGARAVYAIEASGLAAAIQAAADANGVGDRVHVLHCRAEDAEVRAARGAAATFPCPHPPPAFASLSPTATASRPTALTRSPPDDAPCSCPRGWR